MKAKFEVKIPILIILLLYFAHKLKHFRLEFLIEH